VRSFYKDLVWLLNKNSLIERDVLKRKVSILPQNQCSIVTVGVEVDPAVLCYEAFFLH
jgi:hypothetical protein